MPKAIHEELERRATKLGLKGERRNRYIYGTLYKIEHPEKSKTLLTKRKRKPAPTKSSRTLLTKKSSR